MPHDEEPISDGADVDDSFDDDAFPTSDADAEAAEAAKALWDRSPVEAFERLRDLVSDLVSIVFEIYSIAPSAPSAKTTLAEVGEEYYEPLWEVLREARSIWFDTPIKLFLVGESPVHLDEKHRHRSFRGTCYQDLALSLAYTVVCHTDRRLAWDYVKAFRKGVSDDALVGDLLEALKVEIQCECVRGIRKWNEQGPAQELARHSQDFRSVVWYGSAYTFTASQAACIRVLWEEWKKGTPEIGEQTILTSESVDANAKRLVDVFRDKKGPNGRHSAWGTMIVQGSTKGSYRLKSA